MTPGHRHETNSAPQPHRSRAAPPQSPRLRHWLLFAGAGATGLLFLGVLTSQVVDTADGRASDGRVVPVMVVQVEPLVEGSGPSRL